MFQKFAISFKAKTFEFFNNETAAGEDDADTLDCFSLLDSAEDFIPDQKVIILKPDNPFNPISNDNSVEEPQPLVLPQEPPPVITKPTQIKPLNTQLAHTLISSVFATVSSIEASYLQLQTAHVPFNEESLKSADEGLVSHFQKLSDFKQFFRDSCRGSDLTVGSSCLEARVQENQSELRLLGTVSGRLQADIDRKDTEAAGLRKKLSDLQRCNSKLGKKLSGNFQLNANLGLNCEVLLTVRVFNYVFTDACRAMHQFSKILIHLMRKAGWDLDLAASFVCDDVDYVKKEHNRYAFLSYVSLGMFRGFDVKGFGLEVSENGVVCNGCVPNWVDSCRFLKLLLEHVSSSPMELLSMNPTCEFSRFCEKKYQELIHPTMESSIFSNLDQAEVMLNSWRSLSMFYESFVNMASSVWVLHKLAFSFDPVVENFQVERGVDFSMVYMEDVMRRCILPSKTRMKYQKVWNAADNYDAGESKGFTPGFEWLRSINFPCRGVATWAIKLYAVGTWSNYCMQLFSTL